MEATTALSARIDQTTEGLLRYLLAGNARATLRSARTGTRYTYRIRASRDGAVWFVSVLTGPDNTSNYEYLGTIFGGNTYRRSSRSRIGATAGSAVAFDWLMRRVNAALPLTDLEVYHEGRCGRCQRALTTPESVSRGLGPECEKRRTAQ